MISMVLFKDNGSIDLKYELPKERVKGVCWVGGDSIVSNNLEPLLQNNVEWISQTPFAWMRGHDNPEIQFDNSRAWWGERDAGIIHTTTLAHEKGIKVMLKPHIWVTRANGKWRSDIEMKTQAEWDYWFRDYENMILHYARLAQSANIDALCIGTELLIPSTKHGERWIDIIAKIRTVYSGELTYAANFYKEFEEITFWDHLDYIGVQAYFSLASKNDPDLKSLKSSWRKHASSLEKISRKYNKKVVFTEVGYKNTSDAAIEPWLWPRQLEADKIKESEAVQANCYEAMFSTLWNEEWFGGVYIWKWFHGNHQRDYSAYKEWMIERRRKRAESRGEPLLPQIDFTPQDKLAEKVMARYYGLK
jgi:hypothetical protein